MGEEELFKRTLICRGKEIGWYIEANNGLTRYDESVPTVIKAIVSVLILSEEAKRSMLGETVSEYLKEAAKKQEGDDKGKKMVNKEECEKKLINIGMENGNYIEANRGVIGYRKSIPAVISAMMSVLTVSDEDKDDMLYNAYVEYSNHLKERRHVEKSKLGGVEDDEDKGEFYGGE